MGRATCITSLLHRLIAILLLCVAAQVNAAPVWVTSPTHLMRADIASDQTLQRYPLAAASKVAPTSNGGVWALSAKTLVYIRTGDAAPVTVGIAAQRYGDGRLLAADPYDHSAWVVTADNLLAHFDTSGALLGGYTLQNEA